jgi:hypothetical protein
VVTELLVILEGLSAANRLQQLVVVLRKKLTDRRAPLPPAPLPFPPVQPQPRPLRDPSSLVCSTALPAPARCPHGCGAAGGMA